MAETIYDAVIVGSGASGGWAAKELTEAGLETLLLDAGPHAQPSRDFAHHHWPYQKPFRGFPPRGAEVDSDELSLFWRRHPDHPYTTPPDKPFSWGRSRVVGGRTLHWSRATHRLSDYDFKNGSISGMGPDWPISYADIAPYYDKVEAHIGVSGYLEGYPQLPDGKFLPGMPYNCGETVFRSTALKMGLPATHRRIAQLSRPHLGRPKCHFCGACGEGCDIGAMFNSVVSTIPPAEATKRLTVRADAIVDRVLMGPDGRATGVHVIDRVTHRDEEIRARYVIVAASALESTRILLNSAEDGLGNSSGTLGKYVMDQVAGASVTGILPQLRGREPRNDDGKASGMFIARSTNLGKQETDFAGGYCISGSGGQTEFPYFALSAKGYGHSLKEGIRRDYPAYSRLYMSAGDMLPREDNYVELDPNVKDAWGMPALRIVCTHSDNERRLFRHGLALIQEVFEAAGGEIVQVGDELATPGGLIHEVGSCRMGADPKTSVLDPYCRMHDVPNVYVFSGAPFVTTGTHHPTLTMMALTVRGCERLVEAHNKREA